MAKFSALCFSGLQFTGWVLGVDLCHSSSQAVAASHIQSRRSLAQMLAQGQSFSSKKWKIGNRCWLRANLPHQEKTHTHTHSLRTKFLWYLTNKQSWLTWRVLSPNKGRREDSRSATFMKVPHTHLCSPSPPSFLSLSALLLIFFEVSSSFSQTFHSTCCSSWVCICMVMSTGLGHKKQGQRLVPRD